jgi:phosphoglucosamine mutase
LAALQVLAVLKESGKRASEILNLFSPVPQLLKNVRFEKGAKPLDKSEVQEAVKKAEATLAASGRLLVRSSGTEPLIRVMAEGDDQKMVESVVDGLCAVITKAAS